MIQITGPRMLIVLLLFAFILTAAQAGDRKVVYCKTGEKHKGEVLTEDEQFLILKIGDVTAKIPKKIIEKIVTVHREAELSLILVKEKREAQEIREMIKSGMEFGDAAEKYSLHPTSLVGGETGLLRENEIPAAIREEVFKTKGSRLSRPMKAKEGFYLFKVKNSREVEEEPEPEKEGKPPTPDKIQKIAVLQFEQKVPLGSQRNIGQEVRESVFKRFQGIASVAPFYLTSLPKKGEREAYDFYLTGEVGYFESVVSVGLILTDKEGKQRYNNKLTGTDAELSKCTETMLREILKAIKVTPPEKKNQQEEKSSTEERK